MELKLYDTLTRDKRVFTPLDPTRVRMYVCGPTVYDFAHIGNARPVIVFDVLFRLLRHLYGAEHVTYVRNITDVDDKINARAAERGIDIRELTEETYKNFKEDVAALGCLRPSVEPRATEHIEEMKALIERLVASGNAYVAEEHVLFSVPSMKDYGKLSKRPLDEMIAGARVEVAPYKRDPMDFVLWKPSKPGEPAWPSPAGIAAPGRPGWHIECSAMADRWLWTEAKASLSEQGLAHPHQFDIHGGGIDLVFPHHENEIAQSRCAFHTKVMANYWMHNGFLQVEGEKMSKSLGNFVTIRELLRGWMGRPWTGSAIRLAMLTAHYRQPIDWTLQRLEEARLELDAFAIACDIQEFVHHEHYDDLWSGTPTPTADIVEALCDDLNTPDALVAIRGRLKALSKNADIARAQFVNNVRYFGFFQKQTLRAHLLSMMSSDFSGVPVNIANQARELAWNLKTYVANNDIEMVASTETKLNQAGSKISVSPMGQVSVRYDGPPAITVDQLVTARNDARKAKNFTEADRIRNELAALGVVLHDTKDGTTWEIAR